MSKKEILKLIKANCRECIGGNINIIEACPSGSCRLFVIRGGIDRSPNIIRSEISKALIMNRRSETSTPEYQFSS